MTREPWTITRDMFLSVDEVDDLLAHVGRRAHRGSRDERLAAAVDRVIVESLLFSGLRNTEFCRLSLADVDFAGGQPAFHVRGTPREDRTVFIPVRLARLLREFVADFRPRCLSQGVDARDRSQPLVPNERGRRYERTALYRRVVRILTEAGLAERASVQLLRHTYGYLAYLRSGGNLLFVQRQLGHAHPMVTIVYAEFVEESYAALADRVSRSNSIRHSPGSRGRKRAARTSSGR